MRILEATIAVMIVAGVMIVVYSKQTDRGVAPADYFYSLQREILSDIAMSSDLRLNVLYVGMDGSGVSIDNSSDGNFSELDAFVGGKIPSAFDYSVQVCELGSSVDYCKMEEDGFVASMDSDVFVEEIVISSELTGDVDEYKPKKVRLYIWGNM